jgi:hypothetical protein
MSTETCPTCGATLTVKVPAQQVRSGTVGGAGGQIPTTISSVILECPGGHYWTQHGVRLDPLG